MNIEADSMALAREKAQVMLDEGEEPDLYEVDNGSMEIDEENDTVLLALQLAVHALENSKPIMSHYPEPIERHENALKACRTAIAG
jgi:hypothetical protein